MIGGGTAQLQVDLRFRAAPLETRGAYRMLLDFADACGDVVAKGRDGIGAAALALDVPRDEASRIVATLAEYELVRVEASRLCLMVGTSRGKHGGMSPAERKRVSRNKASTPTPPVAPAQASQPPARTAPTPPAATDVTGQNGSVTGEATVIAAEFDNGHGLITGACHGQNPSLPPSPFPSPLHPPSSLSLTLSPLSPSGRVAADAAPPAEVSSPEPPKASEAAPTPAGSQPAPQASLFGGADSSQSPEPKPDPKPRPKREPKPKAEPVLPFKIGEALAALADAASGRFTPGEDRDITRVHAVQLTGAVKRYPVLDEWRVCGEWLAAGGLAHMPEIGLSWVTSAALNDAMARSRRWNSEGRPALVGRISLPTVSAPAAPPVPRAPVVPDMPRGPVVTAAERSAARAALLAAIAPKEVL